VESITECQPEFADLIHLYYSDTRIHDGLPYPDQDWNHYYTLDAKGMMLLVTARNDDEKLIGVALYTIAPHPHYRNMIWAYCDTLAVDPSCRRRGVGRRLVEEVLPRLKEMGVRFVTNNHRTVYEVVPLFPKLGFKLMEQCYVRELV
jgi:ribosomal protein S18 acetylase RimI-like enzyme